MTVNVNETEGNVNMDNVSLIYTNDISLEYIDLTYMH